MYTNVPYLSYAQLRRMFLGFDKAGRDQIVDYIISRYSVIRFDLLESCYGVYENMLTAINSNAGREYEINEVRYVRAQGYKHTGDVITLPDEEKFDLYVNLSTCTSANRMQIGKFLRSLQQGLL